MNMNQKKNSPPTKQLGCRHPPGEQQDNRQALDVEFGLQRQLQGMI
jgi:hypothetical protein